MNCTCANQSGPLGGTCPTCQKPILALATPAGSAVRGSNVADLEAFMRAVAKEVNCLPSYADCRPDGGNAHIIQKIRELKQNSD